MSVRIPSSLKWLVEKRARLQGEIEALAKSHAEAILAYQKRHQDLQADLAAIDRAMGLHAIRISPEAIGPIAYRDTSRRLPYGSMTRFVFEALRVAGGIPLTSDEITHYVCQRYDPPLSEDDWPRMRYLMQSRLKGLAAKGRIVRVNANHGNTEGQWLLPRAPKD